MAATHTQVKRLVTLAYEDQWPFAGDYDFNDLVVNYRTTLIDKEGQAIGYKIEGELVGIGADFRRFWFVCIKR